MTKTFKIGTRDYTNVFTPTGYTVSYIKRRGVNSGVMLDGSYTDDVLGTKAVVTCYCMPTNETQLKNFLVDIAPTYVQVYFYDPKIKAHRTMTAMPSEPVQAFKGTGSNAVDYWTGTVVTFTEK